MLGDPTLLRAEGGSILGEKGNTTIISWYYLNIICFESGQQENHSIGAGLTLTPLLG